uniref:Uncharacterized protein n=1 Tax=Anguilla anguilla TaxID=7936 RepID=A0A0E9V8L6_ANGAN
MLGVICSGCWAKLSHILIRRRKVPVTARPLRDPRSEATRWDFKFSVCQGGG